LYRLFSREGAIGRKLLEQVRKDLSDVTKICQGELKQTNHLRALMSALIKGLVQFEFLRGIQLSHRADRNNPGSLATIQS
jgi:dynein heavy chain 1